MRRLADVKLIVASLFLLVIPWALIVLAPAAMAQSRSRAVNAGENEAVQNHINSVRPGREPPDQTEARARARVEYQEQFKKLQGAKPSARERLVDQYFKLSDEDQRWVQAEIKRRLEQRAHRARVEQRR